MRHYTWTSRRNMRAQEASPRTVGLVHQGSRGAHGRACAKPRSRTGCTIGPGAGAGSTESLLNETFLTTVFPNCSLPANLSRADWPLKPAEFDAFDRISRDNPSMKVPTDPYERAYRAYYEWCNPTMCSKVTKKGVYLRTMQGVAVFGGMWGIITLAIMVLWQCLFLGCVVGHQQQKAGTGSLHGMPNGAGLVKGCSGAATPVDGCVSIEPESQSMDRAVTRFDT